MAQTKQSSDEQQIVMPDDIIRDEDFSLIFTRAYAEYMAATIVDRAIPDARDGLKPVQRRILYCMYTNGYRSNRSTIKSAKIVGQVTGEYHPHGDAAIYQTMARMSQNFTMRYPLIDGQGNFVNIDADPPAAARYTEARLSLIAEVLLADVDQDSVPLVPTYLQDPRCREPLYLTGHLPPICNPISGVAVAMSTNVPPHNLGEVLDAAIALLDKPQMTTKEVMRYIQGPDFPTGGRIIGVDGIKEYLETGKGRFVMRGTVKLEESAKGQALVITEIPYTTKDRIKESIAKAINERKIDGITDLRDESDEDNQLRIVLNLRKDADAVAILNALYQHTDLQMSFNAQMVFLVGEPGQRGINPRQLGVVPLLVYWNNHQLDVLTKRLQYELRRAKDRLHIVRGLIVGAVNAQTIVRIFQQAADRNAAKEDIKHKYKLSEIQADTIAQMTLSQVTKLDASHYENERKSLEKRIAELEGILNDQKKLIATLKSEYRAVKERFADPRRTVIDHAALEKISVVENIIDQRELDVWLLPNASLRVVESSPRRRVWNHPRIAAFKVATTDYVLFISNLGKIYSLRANKLLNIKGEKESLRKMLALAAQEDVIAAFAIPEFSSNSCLVQVTRSGRIKKSSLYEYRSADASGLADFNLQNNDSIVTAFPVTTSGHYLIVSSDGKALRFDDDVRVSGRVGIGVQAIALKPPAKVLAAWPIAPDDERMLVTVTREGFFKRTPLAEYPIKGRATGGVQALRLGSRDELVAATLLESKGKLLVQTNDVIQITSEDIVLQKRDDRGARLAKLPKGAVVRSLQVV